MTRKMSSVMSATSSTASTATMMSMRSNGTHRGDRGDAQREELRRGSGAYGGGGSSNSSDLDRRRKRSTSQRSMPNGLDDLSKILSGGGRLAGSRRPRARTSTSSDPTIE
mmetsp:Transcript_41318/g.62447  ORF Transcript_41318/g.62447 Transcript_41318/m.62447 type:complete len:110 (+) Transcript_41318:160-489(+)